MEEAAPPVEAPTPPQPTSGIGRFVYPDGSVFEGEFTVKDGVRTRHGKGKYFGPHFSYEGGWQEDMMHGEGTYIGAGGCVYTGSLDKGQYHGHGRYRWPDGATYEGPWVRGRLHGATGQYTSSEGVIFAGRFFNGLFQDTPSTLVAIR